MMVIRICLKYEIKLFCVTDLQINYFFNNTIHYKIGFTDKYNATNKYYMKQ